MTTQANTVENHAPTSTAQALLPSRRKKSRKGLYTSLALATALLVGWQVWDRYPRAEAPTSYVSAPAQRLDISRKVTATGTLSPLVQVEVGSQISGIITELGADFNSLVKQGDVIGKIDPQIYESALASAEARLVSARADYTKAKAVAENATAQHKRIQSLASAGAMSASDADAALATKKSSQASVSAASAAIAVAKASVEQARLNLEYTTIRSPIDGVVVSRSVDVGQTVAASLSAPVLFLIAEDLRKMEVHTSVSESDVGELKAGMAVEFSVDAFSGETFEGVVRQVRFEATTVSNVVTYDAVVEVANEELKLRPGMTATVSFVIEAREQALVVSNKALSYRPANPPTDAKPAGNAKLAGEAKAAGDAKPPRDANAPANAKPEQGERRAGQRERPTDGAKRARVFVLRDGAPMVARIETGMTDGTSTEIISGLAEGDIVITSDSAPKSSKAAAPAGNRAGNRAGGGSRGPRGPQSVF
tara:strand:- start:28185 stop:29621 length:1437 start_codon:yes stop_codon:yes gene_type:complete